MAGIARIAILFFISLCLCNYERGLIAQTGTTIQLDLTAMFHTNVTLSPTWTVYVSIGAAVFNRSHSGPFVMSNTTVTIMNVTTDTYYIDANGDRTYCILYITTYGK